MWPVCYMNMKYKTLFILVLSSVAFTVTKVTDDLPTLYEYYTEGEISSGLEAPNADAFKLNGKDITILSGSIHYFRVHPEYWRDNLRKLRAMGFNTVQTIVPWNIHEPQKDVYDFGDGENDMSEFADIVKFLRLAQEEDLFVALRPGPYTCAEWEFGGFPSYLLNIPDLEVRTFNEPYLKRVTKYFDQLLPLINDLQFTKGGPVVAVQIENEYGALGESTGDKGKQYMKYLEDLLIKHGLNESLLYTSDGGGREFGSVEGLLATANLGSDPTSQLDGLKQFQPDKPLWVMEYWTGWYDAWFGSHANKDTSDYTNDIEEILKYPASMNLYMFLGGSDFGFLNGANTGKPIVSSYDYAAPLTEAGDYTEKYNNTRELAAKYNPVKTKIPEPPTATIKTAYPSVPIIQQLTLQQLIDQVDDDLKVESDNVIPMESLDINGGSGQSYGFIIYRKTGIDISKNSVLKIEGRVHDVGIVLLDGVRQTEPLTNSEQLQGFGYWMTGDQEFTFQEESSPGVLDIIVENFGRVNYGGNTGVFMAEKKGLWEGDVLLDGTPINGWNIIPMEFKNKWVKSLTGWEDVSDMNGGSPTLYRGVLKTDTLHDTYLDMRGWGKGNVFVNGFNIGRYFSAGPTHTLYVPTPLIKPGENEILVFELYIPASELIFSDIAILN